MQEFDPEEKGEKRRKGILHGQSCMYKKVQSEEMHATVFC